MRKTKKRPLKAKKKTGISRSGIKAAVRSAATRSRAVLPVQVQRIQTILSEKAVDFALPITKMLQAKLSLLESKLSRA